MTRRQLTDGSEQPANLPAELAGVLNMITAASKDKDVDPAKMGQMMDLYERVMAKRALIEWNDAMNLAQEEVVAVRPNRRNPHTGSRYPTYEALDRHLRPIYIRHGFSVTFNTGQGTDPTPVPAGEVRVWMFIKHRGGHTEDYHVDMPADGKGARGNDVMTRTHATGSGMSYGQRYLLKFGFNVPIAGDDDDGNRAARVNEPTSPRAPQSKSERKAEGREEKRPTTSKGRPDGYDMVQKAKEPKTRITESSLRTISSAMKRARIPESKFEADFGFKLVELDKSGLNQTVDWIKASSS